MEAVLFAKTITRLIAVPYQLNVSRQFIGNPYAIIRNECFLKSPWNCRVGVEMHIRLCIT